MKIDLNTELTNLDGTPIPEASADGKTNPTTLKSVFCNVLTQQKQGETVTGIEKVRRYNLATQIYTSAEIDLGVDDTKLLRDLVADGYIALISGQVWNILDPPADTDDGEEERPDLKSQGVETPDNTI